MRYRRDPSLRLKDGCAQDDASGKALWYTTSLAKARARAPAPHSIRLLNQRASVAAVWFFFGGDDYGGGYAVAWLQVQEADALGVAAGFADGLRIHADDFAVVADEHDLGGFVDLGDAYDFAGALGGFDVDDAFAGAVGEAVDVGGSALAESIFGDGEDQGAFDGYVYGFGLGCCSPASSGPPERALTRPGLAESCSEPVPTCGAF